MAIRYPVTVTEYQVSIDRDRARIELKGIEGQLLDATPDEELIKRVGDIEFSDPDQVDRGDLINRGGFLTMHRPMTMLSAILDVLRNKNPLFLHERQQRGTLSTSWEPVSQGEND